MERTLLNEKRQPLERIRSYVDGLIDILEDGWTRKGCILGNFSAELTDDNEAIRRRVVEMFDEIQAAVKNCLKDAIRQGDLPRTAKAESWRAFSCPRSRGPRCFARLTAVSSPCGGSSGFFQLDLRKEYETVKVGSRSISGGRCSVAYKS